MNPQPPDGRLIILCAVATLLVAVVAVWASTVFRDRRYAEEWLARQQANLRSGMTFRHPLL